MSAVDSSSSPKTESKELNADFEWNPETEVHLLYAMKGHKPVGVNRYFQMICIQDIFNGLANKEVPSQVIWEHLDKMYDMEALHENEDLPFPNNNVEFCLPYEFEDLKSRKISPKSEENSNGSKSNDSTATSQSSESTSNSSAAATSNEGSTVSSTQQAPTGNSEVPTDKPKESAKNEEKETKTPKKRGKPPKSGQNGNISNTSTNSSKKRKV